MQADNLEIVSSAYARGTALRCAGANCPAAIGEHDKELQAKYRKLIGETSVFRYTLLDGYFDVRGLSRQGVQGGDFYFHFVWSENEVAVPHCDEKKARLPMCGICYENVEPDWYIYWRWFPEDLGPDWDGRVGEGLPTPEEIEEQANMALDDCLKTGREEMGLGSDAQ